MDSPGGSRVFSYAFVILPHNEGVLFPPNNQANAANRVVITGAGVITAFGVGWKKNAEGFRLGKTAFRPVTLFDVSRQRVKTAAEATLPEMPDTLLSRRHLERSDRAAKMLLLAAHEAWHQSKWAPSENLPIVLGTTSGGMSLGESYFRQATTQPSFHKNQASRVTHYQAQRQALDLADAFGFSGPVTLIANACASGANAIGHAWELLRTGQAERALTGGYDALSHLVFSGFDSLQALSTTTCRPFDAKRDGLALGEGAAVFTLETLDFAQRRGNRLSSPDATASERRRGIGFDECCGQSGESHAGKNRLYQRPRNRHATQ